MICSWFCCVVKPPVDVLIYLWSVLPTLTLTLCFTLLRTEDFLQFFYVLSFTFLAWLARDIWCSKNLFWLIDWLIDWLPLDSLYIFYCCLSLYGSVSIVRRFDSPKIQLKLKLALTLILTDTGDLWTIEPLDYRADTACMMCTHSEVWAESAAGRMQRWHHCGRHWLRCEWISINS